MAESFTKNERFLALVADKNNGWYQTDNGRIVLDLSDGQQIFMGDHATDGESVATDFIGLNPDNGPGQHLTDQSAEAIIEMAARNGWDRIKLIGVDEDKEKLWRAAVKAGLEVTNYTPLKEQTQPKKHAGIKKSALGKGSNS